MAYNPLPPYQAAGSDPGYAYPPVPVPFQSPLEENKPIIMTQPGKSQGGYVQIVGKTFPLNVPPGLEILTNLDRICIQQQVELFEAFFGFETKNKYTVLDSHGQNLFRAKEDTNCCTRNCCGPYRCFDMKIKDLSGKEIIHLVRPLACSSCCFPCCLQSLEVYSPPGHLVGTIEQKWSICAPKYVAKNAQGKVVLRIEGPFCTCSCCCCCRDVKFEILSRDGSVKVGQISKKWSGIVKEALTDADRFEVAFPKDLDVQMKAVLLGATFLIDYMFFERAGNVET